MNPVIDRLSENWVSKVSRNVGNPFVIFLSCFFCLPEDLVEILPSFGVTGSKYFGTAYAHSSPLASEFSAGRGKHAYPTYFVGMPSFFGGSKGMMTFMPRARRSVVPAKPETP